MRSLILLALLLGPVASSAGPFSSTDGLLIEYDLRSDEVINTNADPLVRVYGDGRLVVAIPWYRKNRGYYQGALSAAELAELLSEVEATGAHLENEQALMARVAAESAAKSLRTGIVTYRSETETTRFEFALDGATTMRRSTWKNLRSLSREFKSIGALERLWRADRLMHALASHRSLTKVAEMPISGGVMR